MHHTCRMNLKYLQRDRSTPSSVLWKSVCSWSKWFAGSLPGRTISLVSWGKTISVAQINGHQRLLVATSKEFSSLHVILGLSEWYKSQTFDFYRCLSSSTHAVWRRLDFAPKHFTTVRSFPVHFWPCPTTTHLFSSIRLYRYVHSYTLHTSMLCVDFSCCA